MATSSAVNTTENMDERCVGDETLLKFRQFSSCIDPDFWYKVLRLKLDTDKLDEVHRPLIGYYNSNKSTNLKLDCTSLNLKISDDPSFMYVARGNFVNKNSLDSFQNCDKTEMLNTFGKNMLDDFCSDRAVDNPSLIPTFHVLMHTDFKQLTFYFWFAFPSFINIKYSMIDKPVSLEHIFTPLQFDTLINSFQEMEITQRGFFGIVHLADNTIQVLSLKEYLHKLIANNNEYKTYLVFADPSDLHNYPGWPLRNILYLILLKCPRLRKSVLEVISLRGSPSSGFLTSLLFKIKILSDIKNMVFEECNTFVGWEKNDSGTYCPKYVDLKNSMNFEKQANISNDLNLKLMKWRLVPDLNLGVIAKSKCLIIGAGTLGCCVARNLMSWGVRHITFIDNGTVSWSNPARQSLYMHSDCVGINNYKAKIAANMLKNINPVINSNGVIMSIPMPGHAASADDYKNVDVLSELIKNHDVIFLLTDSRESRWLPTILSTLHNKLAITAALGFDSYLIIRHGLRCTSSSENKLGCYFCNDVTAPGNSFKDKTMDQQCTVTRPGASSIAGALAVELMASYLQLNDDASPNANSCLGEVPHSIRGFLSDFEQIKLFTPCFIQCIACSSIVLNDYLNNKEQFLGNVFTNPNYLEDLTGLTKLKDKLNDLETFEIKDEDSDGSNCLEDLTGLTKLKDKLNNLEILEIKDEDSDSNGK